MPLRAGSTRSVIAANIRELHSGRTYAKTKAKHGTKKANAQAVAIALESSRRSKRRTLAEG